MIVYGSIMATTVPTPASFLYRSAKPVLAVYDSARRALGYGPVVALDPGRRGAGDISFVAPCITGLDGLGAMGSASHTPAERVNLGTLPMQTERAAILMYRLLGCEVRDAPWERGPRWVESSG